MSTQKGSHNNKAQPPKQHGTLDPTPARCTYELDEQRKPDRQHQVPNIYLAAVLCADSILTR
jgi:hypothetical protein